jgi:hypothetical protein
VGGHRGDATEIPVDEKAAIIIVVIVVVAAVEGPSAKGQATPVLEVEVDDRRGRRPGEAARSPGQRVVAHREETW